jgi:winged helix DNA-binding protein
MGGAQAQVLQAAQISIGVRLRDAVFKDLDEAVRRRKLVRAWCMRRTMHLLPSDSLAVFVRGSARRAQRETRWVLSHGASTKELERMTGGVLEALDEPLTQAEMARAISKSLGYSIQYRPGGGWGSRRHVPWLKMGGLALPAYYLLHLTGAGGVICSGPNRGSEATFVRADRWVTRFKDLPVERAESELLMRYLKAFGPATVGDFALWTGMLVGDAKAIWSREEARTVPVDVEGSRAVALESELDALEKAEVDRPLVRLLPHFDSFVLGHKSHRNVVDVAHHTKVYRAQGWVSPVVLVDGRAGGVWSYSIKNRQLEVRVSPFSRFGRVAEARLRVETTNFARFLESDSTETKLSVAET